GVELIGKPAFEVMAEALCLRPVDHADSTLKPRLAQSLGKLALTQVEVEAVEAGFVQQLFIAAAQAWPHSLALGRCIPVRGGGDGAGIGREADQTAVVAIAATGELTDVVLAALAHLGGGRIADVRVVLPDHYLRRPACA